MVLQNDTFINGTNVREMLDRQRVARDSFNRTKAQRRDAKRAEDAARLNDKKNETTETLAKLQLSVGLVVRQTATGHLYRIREIRDRGKGRPPEIYVDGINYSINPLTLERV